MIVIFAAVMGIGANLLMPHGLEFIPPEVSRPLWQEVSPGEAIALVNKGAILVDARQAGDYNTRRVRGALKMPVTELQAMYGLLQDTLRAAPGIVVYGRTLSTFPAATVGQFLREQGFDKVYVCQANLDELKQAGFEVQEPRRRAE